MRNIGADGHKKKVGFTNQYPKKIQVDFIEEDLSSLTPGGDG